MHKRGEHAGHDASCVKIEYVIKLPVEIEGLYRWLGPAGLQVACLESGDP